jgi:hypothetical protein
LLSIKVFDIPFFESERERKGEEQRRGKLKKADRGNLLAMMEGIVANFN